MIVFGQLHPEFLEEIVLDAGDERGLGAEHPPRKGLAQRSGQRSGGSGHHLLVRMLERDLHQTGHRREMILATLGDLAPVHRGKVVALHILQGGMVGLVALYDHLAGHILPSGAPAHLGQQLVGPLESTEVGKRHQGIRVQDAHHTHPIEIQPLGHHLRAHKDVGLVLLKVGDDLLVAVLGAGGVEVHTGDGGLREEFGQGVFHLLGAEALHLDVGAVAGGTLVRHLDGIAAVVALQQIGLFMIGQGDVAILAGGHTLAGVANHPHSITPPVLEEDDLLFFVQGLPYFFNQEVGEDALHLFLARGGGHIDHPDFGQLVA